MSDRLGWHVQRPAPTQPASITRCALLVVLLFTAACGGGAPAAPWRGKNVLLISVDTLRRDHLSLYGYERETTPRIDAFFGRGEVYTRAYAPYTATTPSLVSLLTGMLPTSHGVRLLNQRVGRDVRLLSDLLSTVGYRTAAVVSNDLLSVESSALGAHFESYDDFVDERERNRDVFQRRAPGTTAAALRWLALERQSERPHFLWVHYMDPHGPYDAPADRPVSFAHAGERIIEASRLPAYQRVQDTSDGLDYVDEYDAEIAYMDREVGRLLDAYASLGLLDDTVVVFTADHGETMLEHDEVFTHGHHVWEALARVPLMIRAPGGEEELLENPVSLVDVVPTILTRMGLTALREGMDGMPLAERPPRSPISIEVDARDLQHRAMILGTRKWFLTVDREGRVAKGGWVDLERELESDLELRKGRGDGFEPLLEWARTDPDPGGIPVEYERGTRLTGPKIAPPRSARELEALRRLGYVR